MPKMKIYKYWFVFFNVIIWIAAAQIAYMNNYWLSGMLIFSWAITVVLTTLDKALTYKQGLDDMTECSIDLEKFRQQIINEHIKKETK